MASEDECRDDATGNPRHFFGCAATTSVRNPCYCFDYLLDADAGETIHVFGCPASASLRNPCYCVDDPLIPDLRNPAYSFDDLHLLLPNARRRRRRRRPRLILSSLPDEILQLILSLLPFKLAITTSILSKRWRHLWSNSPSISLDLRDSSKATSICETLAKYSAPKITSFHLSNSAVSHEVVNSLIEFALSHNVENLSLSFVRNTFPDFFFSMQQCTLIRNLSLSCCELSDESFPMVLSGCPMLESLKLYRCGSVSYLDFSECLRLTRLDMDCNPNGETPIKIVAPHILYLRLRNTQRQCTLVDVSSLNEANLELWYHSDKSGPFSADSLQVMVQSMLEKLHNVERLTLGLQFIQILTLAELRGVDVPFPTLNVKTLTIETTVVQSVVPGIARLLQSSPLLKKITVHTANMSSAMDLWVNGYLASHESNLDQSWRSKMVAFPTGYFQCKLTEPERVALLLELLLANTTTLETLVVHFVYRSCRLSTFRKLFRIARTLSHENKVSILFKERLLFNNFSYVS